MQITASFSCLKKDVDKTSVFLVIEVLIISLWKKKIPYKTNILAIS